MKQLKALYYPWVAIQRPETLKKALIYFDKVLLLCDEDTIPKMRRWRDTPWWSKEFSDFAARAIDQLEEFLQETIVLRDQGVLEFVSPREVMNSSKTKAMIYASVVHDFSDVQYRYQEPKFSVFGNDYGLIDISNHGGYAMLDYFSIDFHDIWKTKTPNCLSEVLHTEKLREIYSSKNISFDGLGIAHFVQSFAVAQALYVGTLYNATLFTDDKDMQFHLFNKLRRLFSTPEVREFLGRYLESVETRGGLLANRLLESLPDLSINSYEDILEVRLQASNEFEQFRSAIESFAASISSLPNNETFERDVDEIVRGKINPAIVELKTKLRTSKSKTIQRIVKRIIDGKVGIPFALSIFSGLPVEAALLASLVLLGLDVSLETYFEIREIRESNSLSFLLNFK